jgi:hypothetical protein
MFIRSAAAVLAAMMILNGVPAWAQAADPTPVVAGRTVTVDTSKTGKVRLEVPTDATIDLTVPPAISGEGSFVGFLLTEPGTMDEFNARAIRFPETIDGPPQVDTRGQLAVEDREPHEPTSFEGILGLPRYSGCSVCNISPGVYDLYVIADGEPVSISLTLDGLTGALELVEEDLTPVQTAQQDIGGSETVGLLEEVEAIGISDQVSMGAGVVFSQHELISESTGAGRVSHSFCLRTVGSENCDVSSQTFQSVTVAENAYRISWPAGEVVGGDYEAVSRIHAANTVPDLTWQARAVSLFLGY